jgi:hypothetical protein
MNMNTIKVSVNFIESSLNREAFYAAAKEIKPGVWELSKEDFEKINKEAQQLTIKERLNLLGKDYVYDESEKAEELKKILGREPTKKEVIDALVNERALRDSEFRKKLEARKEEQKKRLEALREQREAASNSIPETNPTVVAIREEREKLQKLIEEARAMPQPNIEALEQKLTEEEFPKMSKMIENFSKAVVRDIKARVEKKPPVSPEEAERRYAICKTCEFFKNERCLKCGCYLKFKTAWRAESCPVGKW